ncbi:MAG TPA: hypothetical protein ENK06_14200 [Gammaproteobacteria bacterium]|nr:hypothetical protein [Gammaproteobacteria bacterium]
MMFADRVKKQLFELVRQVSPWSLLVFCALLLNLAIVNAADAKAGDTHPAVEAVFAEVNGEQISVQEFQSAFRAGMRKRFYHGKIPHEKLQEFRKEVSQTLIDRVLLIEEARRLGLTPDEKKVGAQLAAYEKRYASSAFWRDNKSQVIPGLRKALEGESLMAVIERKVKQIDLPDEEAALQFYRENQDLFITPEKMRVSLILLKVAPSSSASVWEAAKQEADDILERLANGADFAEMARIHSGDASAANGGDMGFIHQGMLAEPAQKALDKLSVGQISPAVISLRGIAIFRLEEKSAATLNKFAQVKERAIKLLQREKAALAWRHLLEKLRANADIKINNAVLAANNK